MMGGIGVSLVQKSSCCQQTTAAVVQLRVTSPLTHCHPSKDCCCSFPLYCFCGDFRLNRNSQFCFYNAVEIIGRRQVPQGGYWTSHPCISLPRSHCIRVGVKRQHSITCNLQPATSCDSCEERLKMMYVLSILASSVYSNEKAERNLAPRGRSKQGIGEG